MAFAGIGSEAGSGELFGVRFRALGEAEEGSFQLRAVQLNEGGISVALGSEEVSLVPERYGLSQNYPNPFNAQTTLRFDLPEAGEVALTIYNLSGQRVRTLVDGYREAGTHAVLWDGKDGSGRDMASGIYFYRFEGRMFVDVKRMVMMK